MAVTSSCDFLDFASRVVFDFSQEQTLPCSFTHTHTHCSLQVCSQHTFDLTFSLSVIISFKENKRAELECKRKSGQSEERSLAFTPPHFFFLFTNVNQCVLQGLGVDRCGDADWIKEQYGQQPARWQPTVSVRPPGGGEAVQLAGRQRSSRSWPPRQTGSVGSPSFQFSNIVVVFLLHDWKTHRTTESSVPRIVTAKESCFIQPEGGGILQNKISNI